jgi:cytochrome P450
MLKRTLEFVERYEDGTVSEIAHDMTMLTYEILSETLFSGEIAGEKGTFAQDIDRLLETMGRVDPLDLLRAPDWLPRLTRIRGRKTMAYFRKIVADTVSMREDRLKRDPIGAPQDFLTLLLRAEGPGGLTRAEVEDNIITFIGAGHETTARALGWTLYCLAEAPWEREPIEREVDAVLDSEPDPAKWLDLMPLTRAAFGLTGGPPQAIFVPPPGAWIAVSSSWSQTSGQPSAALQKYPTCCVPSQASSPRNPQPARKPLPGSITQNSLPSGSASTTCPSSGS